MWLCEISTYNAIATHSTDTRIQLLHLQLRLVALRLRLLRSTTQYGYDHHYHATYTHTTAYIGIVYAAVQRSYLY